MKIIFKLNFSLSANKFEKVERVSTATIITFLFP